MGTVKREARDGASTTFLEFDGSIIQLTEEAEVCVSADGEKISRRTADRLDVVTGDGRRDHVHAPQDAGPMIPALAHRLP